MKYPASENHLCAMNDGECICNCFDEGYQKAVEEILAKLPKEKIPNYQLGGNYVEDEGFNQCLTEIKEILNNFN